MWMWIVAAATAVWLCLRSAFERKVFTTDVYELRSEKVTKEYTFAFLSDLHDNKFGPGQRRLLAAIDRVRPDAVLIGGDMMVVKQGVEIENALYFLKRLARRYPVYCGNGNHENRLDRDRRHYGDRYDRYVSGLTAAGVTYLSDASAVFDGEVQISGLDLPRKYYRKRCPSLLADGFISRRLGQADGRRFQILLVHSPKFFDAYCSWGADLALTGHYHGGTIWLPFLGGVMTPQYEFFRKDCQGLHKKGKRCMIVSRGLGTHSINLRLNDRAQLVVVKVRPGQEVKGSGQKAGRG